MDKFWMVVNMSDAVDSETGSELPAEYAPKKLYDYKEDAESEMISLQEKRPFDCFVLMEAAAHSAVGAYDSRLKKRIITIESI